MQGPGDPRNQRRAGDNGNAAGPDSGLKDWQRNTWFGPAPSNTNPFEEPENAPELLRDRSTNVSEHKGEFWEDRQNTGYQFTARRDDNKKGTGKMPEIRRRKGTISVRSVLVVVLVLVAAVCALYFGVFRIRDIQVIGNRDISASDVIRFSGVRRGGSILSLSESETKRRLETEAVSAAAREGNYNYYRLEFRYLDKQLPGTVILSVREREACCWLTWCGIVYVMDKNGMVLYESEDDGIRNTIQLVEVKGLDIRSGARAGQTMVLASEDQEHAFRDLFLEMKVLGCTGEILEADLSNPSSILLTTRDGFNVSLGSAETLHAKLRSLLLVRDKLREMGKTGGTINVSAPAAPYFSPAAPQ